MTAPLLTPLTNPSNKRLPPFPRPKFSGGGVWGVGFGGGGGEVGGVLQLHTAGPELAPGGGATYLYLCRLVHLHGLLSSGGRGRGRGGGFGRFHGVRLLQCWITWSQHNVTVVSLQWGKVLVRHMERNDAWRTPGLTTRCLWYVILSSMSNATVLSLQWGKW